MAEKQTIGCAHRKQYVCRKVLAKDTTDDLYKIFGTKRFPAKDKTTPGEMS
jgi:hypothetical protein